MSGARVVFDHVWKQFTRGERHDSLRDLVPSMMKRLTRRGRLESPDAFWAVEDVSFEVREGEALGIIGRNGAGKSTILKLLTRILRPTRGSRRLEGRTGALIEIAAGFHPDLTGRENVFLQGAIMGMRRREIAARFDEIVSFAGLERFVDTPVKRYSSGMNARLGFSIAAHFSPDVLIIDEVLAVGDRAFQEKCQERMRRFRSEGVAIVFVSHHLAAVAQLCSQVLLLESGVALKIGTPTEVIAAYCHRPGTERYEHVTVAATLRSSRHIGEVFDVEPGERLKLDVSLDFRVPVERAKIGVVVRDQTRDLYVYGASSDLVGVPPIRAAAGETKHFVFAFDANLTRGLYGIEVNVVDPDRHQFLAVARGIQQFNVVEQVTYDGIANLYLTGSPAGVRAEPVALAR